MDTLEIDLEYNREHKRYLLRALEWDNGERSNSFLLTGDEIATAEAWLMEGASKDPTPTELHTEYIQASRQLATRRQRMLVSGVSVALIVSVILTILSLVGFYFANANEAEARAQEAIARVAQQEAERSAEVSNSLALASAALQPTNKDIAVAMALEATQIENPPGNTITALMQSALAPGARQKLALPFTSTHFIFEPATSSNLRYVILANEMFDMTTSELVRTFESAPDTSVVAQFLPSNEAVIIAGDISFETQGQQEAGEADLNLITMGVYSVADGSLIQELSQEAVSSLQLNTDGTQVFVQHPASNDYAIYDIATSNEITRIPSPEGGLKIFADFTQYAYIAQEEDAESAVLRIVDVTSDAIQIEIPLEPASDFIWYEFAVSPTGRTVAVTNGRSLMTYDVQSGEAVTVFDNFETTFSNSNVQAMGYTPSGKHLFLGVDTDSRLNVWDTTTGLLVDSFRGHNDSILVTAVPVNNQYLLSLDLAGNVVLWDLKNHLIDGSFVSASDYLNPETDEFLVLSPNRTITRISLDTFLPVGEAFSIPEDIQVVGYDYQTEVLFGSRGETSTSPDGYDEFNASSLVLMSAETGDVINESPLDVLVDDLSEDSIFDGNSYKFVMFADMDAPTITQIDVSQYDIDFLPNSLIAFELIVGIEDTSSDVKGSTSQGMIWDVEAETVMPFSLEIAPYLDSGIQEWQDGLFVAGASYDAEADERVQTLVQLDPQTLEEVSRIQLDDDTTAVKVSPDGTQFMSYRGSSGEKSGNLNIHEMASGEVLETYTISTECCTRFINYDPISNRLGYFESSGGGGGGQISPSLGFSIGGTTSTAQVIDVSSGAIMWNFTQGLSFMGYTSDYSRMVLRGSTGRYFIYRNDSLVSMVEWTCANRYVAPLDDDLRQAYGITSTTNACGTLNTD